MLGSAALILAVALGQSPTSTPQEFQELGELMVGRWSGDITLIADWPGMKKKAGEKLIGYTTVQWIADRSGFINKTVGGETTGFSMWCYDPATKQILVQDVNSAGGTLQAVVWKESETTWGFKVTGGALADGRKSGGKGHLVFKDKGRTHVVEGNMTLDGEALPTLRDVYTRLDD